MANTGGSSAPGSRLRLNEDKRSAYTQKPQLHSKLKTIYSSDWNFCEWEKQFYESVDRRNGSHGRNFQEERDYCLRS